MGNAVNAAVETEELNTFESSPEDLQPGTTLLQGQYTILKYLNSGGFAITYLARDSLDRVVVIKECFPSSFCRRSKATVQARSRAHQSEFKSIVKLFVQEARSLAKLNHPNIVGVHQVFEDNSTAYMALDLIKGRDLLDTLEDKENGLRPAGIKNILIQILGAVKYLHSQNILHRDISPDNILLNDALVPVLIDFGAAREKASQVGKVMSAMRVVKDGYSPQEFYIAGSAQSNASDLYSLGATFYHLITGEIPPDSQTRLAAMASREPDPCRPLAGQDLGYDQSFLAAIDKAMRVMQRERLRSADEWLAAIKNQTAEVVTMQRAAARVAKQQSNQGGAKKAARTVAPVRPPVAMKAVAKAADAPKPVQNVEALTVSPGRRRRKFFAILLLANVPAMAFAAYALVVQPDFLSEMFRGGPTVSTADLSDATNILPATAAAEVFVAPSPISAPNSPTNSGVSVVPIVWPNLSFDVGSASMGELIATPDTETKAAEVTPPSPQPPADVSRVDLQWSVEVPFVASDKYVVTILQTLPGAENWMRPGQIIDTVNGQTINSMAKLERIVRNSVDVDRVTDIPVVFGIRDSVGRGISEKNAVLKITQRTALKDGTIFQTVFQGDSWLSTVAAVSDQNGGNLEVGDAISAYLGTQEMVSGRTTLGQIIDREFGAGKDRLHFMIDREGADFFASISVAQVRGPQRAPIYDLTTGN